jgi:hypothetical protein
MPTLLTETPPELNGATVLIPAFGVRGYGVIPQES